MRGDPPIRWDQPYDTWLSLGMALHSWDPVHGLALWIADSQRSPTFVEGECEQKGDSFGAGGITIGTLFGFAYEADAGWFQRDWDRTRFSRARDRAEVPWDWSGTPRQAGERELILVVEVEWIPQGEEEGETLGYQLGRERLDVVVAQPLVVFGESIAISQTLALMIIAIVSGGIGFFLSTRLKRKTRSPGDEIQAEQKEEYP